VSAWIVPFCPFHDSKKLKTPVAGRFDLNLTRKAAFSAEFPSALRLLSNSVNQFVMERAAGNAVAPQSCPSSPRKAAIPKNLEPDMIRNFCIASIFITLVSASAATAQNQRVASLDANGNLDALIARHAAANNVPEALLRRVIKRESGGNPRVISKGNYGLMQIRLGTARALGYRGTAAGLLDADTNMTYAVKYLAGAYHAAAGDHSRAVHYYAAGYYYAAKRKGLLNKSNDNPLEAFAANAAASHSIAAAPAQYAGPGSINFK
jgi:soluble lytic murein transglycosylase-like protein